MQRLAFGSPFGVDPADTASPADSKPAAEILKGVVLLDPGIHCRHHGPSCCVTDNPVKSGRRAVESSLASWKM